MAVGLEHRFGPYGGQYVPETLMPALAELESAWLAARRDPSYAEELAVLSRDFSGRAAPLYLAERLSAGAKRGWSTTPTVVVFAFFGLSAGFARLLEAVR